MPAPPPVGFVVERTDEPALRLVATGVAPAAGTTGFAFERIASSGWMDSLQALRSQPRVTVARYDVLRAALMARGRGLPPLEIVAPLAVEPVLIIARADSTMQSLQDLHGARINSGPAAGARALTARGVYGELFGGAPTISRATVLEESAALDELTTGHALDAVLHVGEPLPDLSRFLPLAAHGLKLLTLDTERPVSHGMGRMYLTTQVGADDLSRRGRAASTLGVMAFLVTARPTPDVAARSDGLLVRSLCTRTGQRPWPAAPNVDIGWPYASAAASAWHECMSTN